MSSRERKLVILNYMQAGPVSQASVKFGGLQFSITEYKIGWNPELGRSLVEKHDGHVDGIALSGLQKKLQAGKTEVLQPDFLALLRAAIRTPIYMADDIRELFGQWTLQKILSEQPQIFNKKRALFHCALVTPSLSRFVEAGARIQALDPMVIEGLPLRLRGLRQLQVYLKTLKAKAKVAATLRLSRKPSLIETAGEQRIAGWMTENDIFVTFAGLLQGLSSLEFLRDKMLVIDHLTTSLRERLKEVGVAQLIEFAPSHPLIQEIGCWHFSLLAAMIDQERLAADSPLSFDEYLLRWIQDHQVKPSRLKKTRPSPRRCAFIVHPLSQSDLVTGAGIPLLPKAPQAVKDAVERLAPYVPVFHFGTLRGVVSEATGQEVICDIYAMPATPRQLLRLNEEFVYRKLVDAAELAQKNGASLIGLGAYTKVIGDGGTTVAKRAPIPVTNGNSYSVSATLWAARVMVEKMGLVPIPERGKARIAGKVMVIGATGSIGRVSSLLVSLVFEEVVLVATRPDRLLELRDEVLALSPEAKVSVSVHAGEELVDTDLIVTATSNQGGSILNDEDLERIKPGAVICDCSRPLDITPEMAAKRPDILVIESGEILLPGNLSISCDIGLPKPTVYACLAETVLLALEGRMESFSLSKRLSMQRVKEIYKIGVKHGARLSTIRGPHGIVTDEDIAATRELARQRLKSWPHRKIRGVEPATRGLRRSEPAETGAELTEVLEGGE